jgi:hypothetical protein
VTPAGKPACDGDGEFPGGIILGIQQIFVVRQLFGQGKEIHLVANVFHQLTSLGRITLIVHHQLFIEGFRFQKRNLKGSPRDPTHFEQGFWRHTRPTQQAQSAIQFFENDAAVPGEGKVQAHAIAIFSLRLRGQAILIQ